MSRICENILLPRKEEVFNTSWAFREVDPQVSFSQMNKPTPQSHKESVIKSEIVSQLALKLSKEQNVNISVIEEQLRVILDEIGYEKSLKLIRWLGVVLVKILLQVSDGIIVNRDAILQVKKSMGTCPVIFVPSHRSYADFTLMSYVLFHYDIATPAIAAGMDFQGMLMMGTMLRNTGAFYMRRSYNDDSLYWTTFKEYIHQIVTKGDLPIEFFIEGTRSRSGKSLYPKFGFLNMILKAFFLSEVPDVLFVPVNISYDKVLEEKLFAFELLGVPKPKESTSGFFKSLSIIREDYGKIYFTFSSPISAKQYFSDKIDRSQHNLRPRYQQELSPAEKAALQPFAYEIINKQQNLCVLTPINIISLLVNDNMVHRRPKLTFSELILNVEWLKSVLETYGAYVAMKDAVKDIQQSLVVHKNIFTVDKSNRLELVTNKIVLGSYDVTKLKGHGLSASTMTHSVPFVMLQLYVNPVMHYLIESAIIVVILTRSSCSKGNLMECNHFFGQLFSYEFVSLLGDSKFEDALEKLERFGVISQSNECYTLGNNLKLRDILLSVIQPFVDTYFVVASLLMEATILEEKAVMALSQKHLEALMISNEVFIHPYSLSLDSVSNCLNSLTASNILNRTRRNSGNEYSIIGDLRNIVQTLGCYKTIGLTPPVIEGRQLCMKNKL